MMSRTSLLHVHQTKRMSGINGTDPADPTSVSFPTLAGPAPWGPTKTDGLVVLHGHPSVLKLGLWAAADQSLAGEPVLYLDGANAFDPCAIGRLARSSGMPSCTLLSSIHVMRAFTCHEMVQLVMERLGPTLRASRDSAIILSGPLEPFYDEAVSAAEAVRLTQVLFASLRLLVGQGVNVLCLCPQPSLKRRAHLLEALQRKADRVIEAVDGGEGLLLRERRAGIISSWRIPYEALAGVRA